MFAAAGAVTILKQGINGFYGNNVTVREQTLAAGQTSKSWIDNVILLPDCNILQFFIYVANMTLDAASARLRLQVWRAYDLTANDYQLVFEQPVQLDVNQTGAVYTVSSSL